MSELDAALYAREVDRLTKQIAGLEATVRVHEHTIRLLSTKRDNLRADLDEIASYEIDLTVGTAANVARLQVIAERHLAPTPTLDEPKTD